MLKYQTGKYSHILTNILDASQFYLRSRMTRYPQQIQDISAGGPQSNVASRTQVFRLQNKPQMSGTTWLILDQSQNVAKIYLCISAFSLRLPHVLLHVAKKLLLRTQDATWTTYSVPPQALSGGKCMQKLCLKRSSERHRDAIHLKMTAWVAAKSHCASR